ncbi:MAG: GGDEF domain-containing protein [Acidobacteriaceae bacterium]
MYMPYLMVGYAVALLLMLLGCGVSVISVPGLRGVRLLSWSFACALVGALLLAARPFAPTWLTILLANQALFVAMLLIYCTVADILAAPMRFLPWGIALCVAALAGYAYFTYARTDLAARDLIDSTTGCMLCAAAAWVLFRHADPAADDSVAAPTLRILTRCLAWFEACMAAVYLLRGVLTLLFPPSSFLHLDLIQAAFSWVNLLRSLAIGCGLLWLALCSHRRDLHTLASTDGLTGLLNRRAFEEILDRELRRAGRAGSSLTLLLLDLDSFKQVNDSFGHHAGDEVIRRVSAALRRSLRPMDALARYGGEEFVMLLRDLPLVQAHALAERLRVEIASLAALPGNVSITASFGIDASRPEDSPEEILRRCDEALYRSKSRGRNRVTAWTGIAVVSPGESLRPV